jgi:hypothetical protein
MSALLDASFNKVEPFVWGRLAIGNGVIGR